MSRSQSSNDLSGSVTGPVVQAGHVGSIGLVPQPPAAPTALSGLPPAPPEFSGREAALRVLASALHPDADGSPVTVSTTLSGTAGVGKTAVVLKAAHDATAAGRFPGGVLFVNLQGYDENRYASPETVVTTFLSALGVPDEHFPPTYAGRLALYRSKLAESAAAGRAVLIVLDNAASSDQVIPLLPADPLHRVLVTSRHTLGDLPGSRIVDVGVLTPQEAAGLVVRTLLMRRPDDPRAREDPGTVKELAGLCGHLPLALSVALSILAGDPELSLGELTATLHDRAGRLEELSYGVDAPVTAAFELSYARLRPEEARLFRLLSLNIGQQVSAEAAAALAGVPVRKTRKLLAALRAAHMIEPGRPRGWVRFHDLLRLFAEQRLAEEDDEETVEAAVDRLLEHYRDAAGEAVRRIVSAARSGERADDVEEWLTAELPNLHRALPLAHDRGRFALALPLAHDVGWFLRRRQDWEAGLDVCDTAVLFARSVADEAQYARALYNKGDLLKHMASHGPALRAYEDALALYRRLGDREGEAQTLHSMGTVARREGELSTADRHYAAALALFEELGYRTAVANTLHNRGDTARRQGRPEEARARYERALEIYRCTGNTVGEARTRHHLGGVARTLGDESAARECWEASRAAYEAAGLPQYAEEVTGLLAGSGTADGPGGTGTDTGEGPGEATDDEPGRG